MLGTRTTVRREPFADATRSVDAMALWLATFFAAGATLSLASVALPHEARIAVPQVRLVACSGYPTALLLVVCRRFLRPAHLNVVLGVGTLVVTLGIYFGHGGTASATSAIFYLWSSLYAFAFFSRRAACGHVAWIAACYGGVLFVQHGSTALSQWVLTVGTVVVTGIVVGGLADQIRDLARTDPLTQLPNRRVFEETLAVEAARSARRGVTLTVAIVDLDHFKHVNDHYGHHTGDRLLGDVARAWKAELRGWEMLARYGGDEFALLFPDSGPTIAAEVLDRFRAALPEVAFSVGVATWDGHEPLDRLMARADAALYDMKRARPPAAAPSPSPPPVPPPACTANPAA